MENVPFVMGFHRSSTSILTIAACFFSEDLRKILKQKVIMVKCVNLLQIA